MERFEVLDDVALAAALHPPTPVAGEAIGGLAEAVWRFFEN